MMNVSATRRLVPKVDRHQGPHFAAGAWLVANRRTPKVLLTDSDAPHLLGDSEAGRALCGRRASAGGVSIEMEQQVALEVQLFGIFNSFINN